MSSSAVAFFDGCWAEPSQLSIPLSDRGLQLADGLFETVLPQQSSPPLPSNKASSAPAWCASRRA